MEDYELICNRLFSKLYQVCFGEEAPCLFPKGKIIVKEYSDWYMTLDREYIRTTSSTKPLHQFPHLVSDTLLLQEISYQTYVNGLVAYLHQNKKGLWPSFPLITQVCKIENFKQAKDEVGVLTSYIFKEVTFIRHDPQVKLKEHLQQVGFIWIYSHEDPLPGDLSQQQVLVKSQIQTPYQMTKIDKEVEIKKAIDEKNKASIEKKNIIRIKDVKESSSSSSMSMYSLDLKKEDSEVPSHRSPTLIEAPLRQHLEEVHSSPVMEKIPSERHSIIHEEENISSYNIE